MMARSPPLNQWPKKCNYYATFFMVAQKIWSPNYATENFWLSLEKVWSPNQEMIFFLSLPKIVFYYYFENFLKFSIV
jgi:hypothetical protein